MSDIDIVYLSWSPTPERLAVTKRSFLSLKNCTNQEHELIVVDNGPPDQTEWFKDQEIDKHIINPINILPGPARNQGAAEGKARYIAFVDNDIGFYPNWLNNCLDALEKYPDKKLVATARKTKPMKLQKYFRGMLDEYELWAHCAGMCLVMKRESFMELGQWSYKTSPGGVMCRQMKAHGYKFIWHPTWVCRHMAKSSYHYKKQKFDPKTGTWT